MSLHAPALLLLAVLPCSLSAQVQVPSGPWIYGDPNPCLPFNPDNTIEWPPSGTPSFGRIVIAELDGDQAPEGVAIEQGIAVAFWRLAVYDASHVITFPSSSPPTDVGDIALLPGGAPGGRDAVLMTDPRGLYKVTWVNVAYPDPAYPGYFADPVPIAEGDWIGAAPIHVDYLNGDSLLDVIGVSADGHKVLTLLGDGSPLGFGPGLTITESAAITDAVPVDWNHDGLSRELAEHSSVGVLVRNGTTGAVIKLVRYTSPTGCIARVRDSNAAGDERLAWTRSIGTGSSELVLIDANGILPNEKWQLSFDVCDLQTNVNPTAIVAADYDGNGTEDLLLVHQWNQTAFLLANQGNAPHFAHGEEGGFDPYGYDAFRLSLNPAAPGGIGIPAFGQVDPDPESGPAGGLFDLVFPVTATSRIEVFLNSAYQRAAVGSGQNSAGIISDLTEFGPHATLSSCELRFAFEVPTRYDTYQYLDLVIWEQPGSVHGNNVNPVALSYRHHLLWNLGTGPAHDNAPKQWVHVDQAFEPDSPHPTPLCLADPKPAYYTEFRFVKLQNGIEFMSPIFTGGFMLKSCVTPFERDFDYMLLQAIPGSIFDLFVDTDLPPELTERDAIGLFVPMSSQPPFGGGHPSPGGRSNGGNALRFE